MSTYNGLVHGVQGADELVVESGGTITVKDGGTLTVAGSLSVTGTLTQAGLETKTADFTLTTADSGKTFFIGAVDLTATLPATSAGVVYQFIVKTVSSVTGFSVSPAAADAIHGNGLTSVDDKDLVNSAASDAEGDTVTIIGDGADGWWITSIVGTWAKEA